MLEESSWDHRSVSSEHPLDPVPVAAVLPRHRAGRGSNDLGRDSFVRLSLLEDYQTYLRPSFIDSLPDIRRLA